MKNGWALAAWASLIILAVSLTLIAPAQAQHQLVTSHLCQANGNTSLCIAADDLSNGSPITENTNPRDLIFRVNGNQFCFQGTCYPTGTLAFFNHTNTCIDADVLGQVTVNVCAGIDGVIWAQEITNGHRRFISQFWTNNQNQLEKLTGQNVLFSGVNVAPAGTGFQAWNDVG